jgi:hypothetical protein
MLRWSLTMKSIDHLRKLLPLLRVRPIQHISRERFTVGAFRDLATDVDTSTVTKSEYRARHESALA